MSVEQQDEQIVQEIVGQVMNVTLDDGNVAELDHHSNSASKLNSTDEAIALEVSNLNACDVSTDYTDSEEANADKKDESLHSPKAEEKQKMSISAMLEGKNASYTVAAISYGDDSSMLEGKNTEVSAMTNGIGDESSLPHDSDNLVEEAKKDESPPPSPKEEEDGKQKKDLSMMEDEGNDEVTAVATNNNDGEESDLPFNSTAGQNGGSAHEVSNLLDVSATDSVDNLNESTKTAISPYSPTPKEEEEKQQKDISMVEGNNEVRAMVTESGGEESELAFNSAADVGQNDNNNDGNITTTTNNDMDSDTAANGHGGFSSSAQEGKVEPKQQPPQKTNKTKLCSVL